MNRTTGLAVVGRDFGGDLTNVFEAPSTEVMTCKPGEAKEEQIVIQRIHNGEQVPYIEEIFEYLLTEEVI